jgi:hypothetical protein
VSDLHSEGYKVVKKRIPDRVIGIEMVLIAIASATVIPQLWECLGEDLEECLAFLRFTTAHHKAIRTTNLLERLFSEGRRWTKVTSAPFRGVVLKTGLCQPDHSIPKLARGKDDIGNLVGA